jgi:cyclic pyranopterin phosphate synthase
VEKGSAHNGLSENGSAESGSAETGSAETGSAETGSAQRRPFVYAFEGVLHDLESPPIAARRALDHAGVRLSPEGWRSLAIEAREALTNAGAEERIDLAEVARLVRTSPSSQRVAPTGDPDPSRPPHAILRALEPGHALLPERWARMRSIDRYAIWHAYRVAIARNALSLLEEAVADVLAVTTPPGPPYPPPQAITPESPPPALPGTMPPPNRGHEPVANVSNHLTSAGEVHMVDVARKPVTERRAIARGSVRMRKETLARLVNRDAPKGEVLATARLAGIMAAKRTQELIPLCHPVALTHLEVQLATEERADGGAVHVTAIVDAFDRTGCEMEALCAVTTACLTVYDMLKGIDRDMVISDIVLIEKSGGRSGHYRRGASP